MIEELVARGTRAVVSSRGKAASSLQSKLLKRDETRHYRTVLDIFKDIKDLAGVRVALYFPIDTEPVGKLIEELFPQARPAKHFPEDSEPEEPEGYTATHYCIFVKGTLVEVQVATALMFAWSEVAHDLLYKPTKGPLTIQEKEILDDLLKIVNFGEVKVMELQKSLDQRTLGQLEFELLASWQQKSASVKPSVAQYLPKFARALEQILGAASAVEWPEIEIVNSAYRRALEEVGRGRKFHQLTSLERDSVLRLAQTYKEEFKAKDRMI